MPKDPDKKRVQADLTQEEFSHFATLANDKQWSLKKLTENVIRDFLKTNKKKK
jgi:hypothetical protein